MYLKNLKKWAIPFLRKCDQKSPGCFYLLLKEYLVAMAAYDLTLCAIVFKASKATDVSLPSVLTLYWIVDIINLRCFVWRPSLMHVVWKWMFTYLNETTLRIIQTFY